MFLFLSSSDSKLNSPFNEASEFIIQLPQLIKLHGNWEIALMEIHLPAQQVHDQILVMCNICGYSYISNSSKPLLRKIEVQKMKTSSHIFNKPFYLPVVVSEFNQIKINISNDNFEKISFDEKSSVWCVLHLKEV